MCFTITSPSSTAKMIPAGISKASDSPAVNGAAATAITESRVAAFPIASESSASEWARMPATTSSTM